MTGTGASADEALREVEMRIPDLVLVDIPLHGSRDGIELAAQLKACHDPIAAPLMRDGQQAGELRIRRAGYPRAEVVALVAQRVGLALDAQRLRGRLRLESILDPLTRLASATRPAPWLSRWGRRR